MDFIKRFWENQGLSHESSHHASWGDLFAIELEIETIGRFIQPGQCVLDVGCANGFSTFRQLELHPDATFTGIDYAEAMIAQAERGKQQKNLRNDRVTFAVHSVLDLPFAEDSFDVVYTTRVLINLPSWEEQMQGIEQCLRVVRKGGIVILSEGFWEPLCLLNSLRLLFKLPPLVEHDFNRYLKQARLEAWLRERGLFFQVEDFSSVYYLGSRVLRELIQKEQLPFGDYNSPVNKLFYQIEREYSGGGIGVQQAYIISK
jgi:ubiquinone/menaquinone biosynthesis C-methylase UbiE